MEFQRTQFPLPDGTVNDVVRFADPEGNEIDVVQPLAK